MKTNYELAENVLRSIKNLEKSEKDNTSHCHELHDRRRRLNEKLTPEEKIKLRELEDKLSREYFPQYFVDQLA